MWDNQMKRWQKRITEAWCHRFAGPFGPREERMKFMSQKIRLNATEDVKEFVKAASKCDFDVDISYNRVLIDAKSILGILSMDLTKVLTVTCHGEDHEFNRFLQKYAVA